MWERRLRVREKVEKAKCDISYRSHSPSVEIKLKCGVIVCVRSGKTQVIRSKTLYVLWCA